MASCSTAPGCVSQAIRPVAGLTVSDRGAESARHRLQIGDLGTHLGKMPAGEVMRRLAGADRVVREPQQRPYLIETEPQLARGEWN
jgi:hypothetical protein